VLRPDLSQPRRWWCLPRRNLVRNGSRLALVSSRLVVGLALGLALGLGLGRGAGPSDARALTWRAASLQLLAAPEQPHECLPTRSCPRLLTLAPLFPAPATWRAPARCLGVPAMTFPAHHRSLQVNSPGVFPAVNYWATLGAVLYALQLSSDLEHLYCGPCHFFPQSAKLGGVTYYSGATDVSLFRYFR
jgi:hypothetical protein